MPKLALQKRHLVAKRNVLNEMRSNNMTLQELRLFSIYLSKINPKDQSTRIVRFSIADFQAIMELNQQNITYFQRVAESILTKIVGIPTERGGFVMFGLFRIFKIDMDDNGDWYVEIDAQDEALPLMFDFQGHYFKYELWNTLRLKSKNQLRMYEILKQYERVGYRVMSIKNLKEMLGINENEYHRFGDFKNHVLEVCRKALAEYTDISYTYEPRGNRGRGGKINELKFTITKNKDFVDPLSLAKFIELGELQDKNIIDAEYEEVKKQDDDNDEYIKYSNITLNSKVDLYDTDDNGNVRSTGNHPIYEERIDYLMTACNNEFSREDIVVLFGIMANVVPHLHFDENTSHTYLQEKYRDFKRLEKSRAINDKFNYFKRMVEAGEAKKPRQD